MSRGFLSGGLCPGVFCLGGFCPRTLDITVIRGGLFFNSFPNKPLVALRSFWLNSGKFCDEARTFNFFDFFVGGASAWFGAILISFLAHS